MASIQDLMNYLAEEYLDGLRRNESILTKVPVLTSALSKTNYV